MSESQTSKTLTFEDFKSEVLNDYKLARLSRECSLLGRKEVLTGKAKFGIFGDGKELPQIAMAKAFANGDFRSGYYRDQTFMMAIDALNAQQFFAGLYGHVDIEQEPMSGGRQMGGHFSTHSLDENGEWKNLTQQKNSSSDISPTAGQMPRLLGLAQASKVFRELGAFESSEKFSVNGNEIAWGTIGNASTSEGLFFETINAAGVMQVPMVMSVWDDMYGISVHAKHQTTKESISEILKGFQKEEHTNGFEILTVKGWDYVALIETYQKAATIAREKHQPVLIHVQELTQPQGHSTSGSHERYKSTERLQWENTYDCVGQLRLWIIENKFATSDELDILDKQLKKEVLEAKKMAWQAYLSPIKQEAEELALLLQNISLKSSNKQAIEQIAQSLLKLKEPIRKDILSAARKSARYFIGNSDGKSLVVWIENYFNKFQPQYSSHLFSESALQFQNVKEINPVYKENALEVDARIVLRDNFDKIFEKYPQALVFGEDSGNIGDVNQGLEGLQEKYGETRVADVGIREATILGQGIGMAMRGLRPIAEIQYLDYLLYAIQIMSDDLATLQYRTVGRQKAPLIVRTRGHRLEGIWHSGSPLGMIVNALRGMHILVPRDMTKAAGFYNTLLQTDQPALVIECLNGYRLKEKLPSNLGEFTTPIGKIEVLKKGSDITVVSYGSTLRVIEQAVKELEMYGISVELIDVQSLLPLDITSEIVESLKKTNRLLVVDEDVPGGASAYILQHILENERGYKYLDSAPETLTAKAHRPAYGTDGDYFCKPSSEDVFEKIYSIMHESNPNKFPSFL